MTDDITHDLDLLDDWLAGKGYGEEAGLVLRALSLIHKQAREIEKLRAATGSLVRSLSGCWYAFEPSLRREMGNTNYHCVKEKMDEVEALLDLRAAADALKEMGDE